MTEPPLTEAASPARSPSRGTAPARMQAIRYDAYGEPEVLKLVEAATCRPWRNDVLIRVTHAGVNPIDARLRRGEMKWLLPGGFPRIPGFDVAGEIISAPVDSRFSSGDRVMAFLNHLYGGGYAQYATCATSSAVSIPDSLPFEQAAAVPLAASTALQALRDRAQLRAGQRVLINGASGGVGCFAVQIAVAYGAEVTAVASGKNEDFVRSLGASTFLDYQNTDFTALGENWDVIFDVAGYSNFHSVQHCLTAHGRYVSTEPSFRGLLTTAMTVPLAKRGSIMMVKSRARDLQTLVEMIQQQELKVILDEVLPLQQASQAHRRIESGVERGKLVLDVAG